MEPTLKEITKPAESDIGLRVIEVHLTPDHIVRLALAHRARETCPGETHPPEGFITCPQTLTNQQLITALLAITKAATTAPRLTSLPA